LPAKPLSEIFSPARDSSSNCGATVPALSGGAISFLRNSGGHPAAVERKAVPTITNSRTVDILLSEFSLFMIFNVPYRIPGIDMS